MRENAAMVLLRLKYVMTDTDRQGNKRWYYRRSGRKVRIESDPSRNGFHKAYLAAAKEWEQYGPYRPSNDESEGRLPKHGFVYFIRSGNMVKIGYSRNPIQRLGQLKTGMGDDASYVLSIPGTRKDEMSLHKKFARNRGNGEWFKMGPNLEAHLMVILIGKKERNVDNAVPLRGNPSDLVAN